MRGGLLRRLTLLLAAACGACSGHTTAPSGIAYLDDPSYRRAELVASLVNPADGYAVERLQHYATGNAADWDTLAEWNPEVDPVQAGELDAPGGAQTTTIGPGGAALVLPDDVTAVDDPRLLALGALAFHRYPAQEMPFLAVGLASRSAATQYGLWVDESAGVGGLVRERLADGSGALACTCATCHESPVGTALVPGRPNAFLNVGAAILDASPGATPDALTEAIAARGPGRLDVTTQTGLEPVRIADLRPVQWLGYLQADATVQQRDLTALAIRIETLLITSAYEEARPPRLVSLALATYVMSLAASLPSEATAAAAFPDGAAVFARDCQGCHEEPGLTGAPVPLDVVGTDPTLGESAVRGTGMYRVPSLHGVGSRGPLLHDGTVPSLAAMFDPTRIVAPYPPRLHGAGAIPGHLYGLDLAQDDRSALIAFLSAL